MKTLKQHYYSISNEFKTIMVKDPIELVDAVKGNTKSIISSNNKLIRVLLMKIYLIHKLVVVILKIVVLQNLVVKIQLRIILVLIRKILM